MSLHPTREQEEVACRAIEAGALDEVLERWRWDSGKVLTDYDAEIGEVLRGIAGARFLTLSPAVNVEIQRRARWILGVRW